MWRYYVALAVRSSSRSKSLTMLVIVLMSFGVAACMVCYAVFRITTGDPIPARSAKLYVPQVDNFGPIKSSSGEPPDLLSYFDAMALWQAHGARRQTLVYPAKWGVESNNPLVPPMSLAGDAVTADFFGMFDVPFHFGTAWSAADDAQHATVAVISRALNQRLFGGQNSVGRTIRVDGLALRITGVLDRWNPKPRFFDVAGSGPHSAFDDAGQIYVPFTRAVDLKKVSPTWYCSKNGINPDIANWNSFLHSECAWISAWVELPTTADVQRYTEFLRNYASEQQRTGRFAWDPNTRLRNLLDWLAFERVVPESSTLSMTVSSSFLVIALVNVIGLMLARFMRRAAEIGVRRALGASRWAIYRQFLTEAATIGLAGGLFAIALTLLGLWSLGWLFEPGIAHLVHVDASLVAGTVLLAIGTTLVASLYPTWRAARVQPAWQIKING
ncbi:MAG TPA: FtsX-like permease family protein [Steroidobacteraceae bacterium]